jgi:hypothetical protein
MAYRNPLQDIENRKEQALQRYGATTKRVRRNKLAEVRRKEKERAKWGWLRGGAKGAGAGAAAGAALGSVIPGIGTGIGALAGGLFGGISGGALGSMGPEAEGTVGDLTSAARTIGGLATPNDRLLNMLDVQAAQQAPEFQPTGSNYGADMSQGYMAPLPEEDFQFSTAPDIDEETLRKIRGLT